MATYRACLFGSKARHAGKEMILVAKCRCARRCGGWPKQVVCQRKMFHSTFHGIPAGAESFQYQASTLYRVENT